MHVGLHAFQCSRCKAGYTKLIDLQRHYRAKHNFGIDEELKVNLYYSNEMIYWFQFYSL